jgi:integrase
MEASMARYRENIRLVEASDRYVARLTNQGCAKTTVNSARYALRRLQVDLGNPYMHVVTPEQLDNYFFGPGGYRAGKAASTFNRARGVVKLLFDYGIEMRWLDVNPMTGIRPARPDTPKNRLRLNGGELLVLLSLANNPIERVALSLGMNTGLRSNDIKQLTIFDVSLASGEIQTEIRKTRKLDVKPITMELHNDLVEYMHFYAGVMGLASPADLPNEWLLVPTYRNAAPSEADKRVKPKPTQVHQTPWRMVQRPLALMGYPTKGEGFHTLRRSSARALFEVLRTSTEGRDHALMIVKEFLNHSSVAQTEHYLGLNQERTIRDTLLKDKSFLSALAETEQERVSGNLEVRQWRAS